MLSFIGCSAIISGSDSDNSGKVSILLPAPEGTRGTRAAVPASYTFIITVTNTDGTNTTKSGHSGDSLEFTVNYGKISICAASYDSILDASLPAMTDVSTASSYLQSNEYAYYYIQETHEISQAQTSINLDLKKSLLSIQGTVLFNKTTAAFPMNQNIPGWSYPRYNITDNADDLQCFCYDEAGNFITASQTSAYGTNTIRVYSLGIEGGRYKYVESKSYPITGIPQRIAAWGNYIYYMTAKYGTTILSEGAWTAALKQVTILDRTTGATTTYSSEEFDIITALTACNGRLYIAGEKRGPVTEVTPVYGNFFSDNPSQKYISTYSVYSYGIGSGGSLGDPALYLSYTDDDTINAIREFSISDYNSIMYTDKTPITQQYYTFIYNTISDLASYNGKVYAIRNTLINLADCYQTGSGSGSTPTSGRYAYGNIICGSGGRPVNQTPYQGGFSASGSTYIPCRFIAIKPDEFDFTMLTPDETDGSLIGKLKLSTGAYATITDVDASDYKFDNIRSGSYFNISEREDHLGAIAHIYSVKEA